MALTLVPLMRENLKMQLKILRSYSITGESKLTVHDQCTDFKNIDIDRNKFSESLTVSLDHLERISKHPKFDDNKPVTIFLHGYMNNQRTAAVRKIVEAYSTHGGHNLIVLDWASATAGTYLDAYSNVEPVNCTSLARMN